MSLKTARGFSLDGTADENGRADATYGLVTLAVPPAAQTIDASKAEI